MFLNLFLCLCSILSNHTEPPNNTSKESNKTHPQDAQHRHEFEVLTDPATLSLRVDLRIQVEDHSQSASDLIYVEIY